MMFRPADVIVYCILLVMILYPFIKPYQPVRDSMIRISSDSGVFFADPDKDSLYVLTDGKDSTEVEVSSGKVRVLNSTCRDKYCVKKGWLESSDDGDIVCMPNRVVVSFENKKSGGIDAVTE